MAEVLLFHHILGRTDGVVAFADDLRRVGHVVHTPDLFEGRTFETIETGVEYARSVGFGTLLDRGVQCASGRPGGLVYAGFSFGVMPAQQLTQTRPGAYGAVFLEACVPMTEFGGTWPPGVPVQIHGMDHDPFFAGEGDIDAARALVVEAGKTARADLFLYPGDRHLFTDRSLSSYDAGAGALVVDRVLGFLNDLDESW